MPVVGDCATGRATIFMGTQQNLLLVTNYSMNEGFRGYPRIVQYQVLPEADGTFRLMMSEHLYGGPSSTAPYCEGTVPGPLVQAGGTLELARGLAYCNFVYQERGGAAIDSGSWVAAWNRRDLPAAVRMEMAPKVANPSSLPMVSLHVPIRVTREVGVYYADSF
jgi:hypothetical protein